MRRRLDAVGHGDPYADRIAAGPFRDGDPRGHARTEPDANAHPQTDTIGRPIADANRYAGHAADAGAAGTLLVSVGRGRFTVEIADDQAERTMGLSERDALAADAGMWFDEGTERIASFWMRGMRFPLDFVWVDAALRVVEVTHDVPPPEQGTADADIPRFGAAVPVRFALEINAGLARALEIGPGDVVRLDVP